MKTYINILINFTAIILLTFTACSDNEDIKEIAKNSSITIDNRALEIKSIEGKLWKHNGVNYLTIWVNSAIDNESLIFEVVDEPDNKYFVKLEQGVNLISPEKESYPTALIYVDDNYWDGDIVSGRAILTEFSRENKRVTIELTNCKLKNYLSDETVVINGVLSTALSEN